MVNVKLVAVMIVAALILSSTATYLVISSAGDAIMPDVSGSNAGNVGIHVLPGGDAKVGIMVLPEKEDVK